MIPFPLFFFRLRWMWEEEGWRGAGRLLYWLLLLPWGGYRFRPKGGKEGEKEKGENPDLISRSQELSSSYLVQRLKEKSVCFPLQVQIKRRFFERDASAYPAT